MNRTYIKDLGQKIGLPAGEAGEEVLIKGWIDVRRDQGKMIFFDFRDMSGKVQGVVLSNNTETLEVAKEVRPEWVVAVTGKVNARPEKNVKADVLNGNLEIEVLKIEILGRAKELPFDKDAELNLDTHLDYLPLTLRTDKAKAIFKVQASLIKYFREFLNQEGFTEIQAPKLIGDDAEGGANSFDVEYFGHTAHLAQSPQFYKQIMTGVFERVYAAGNVYRAEKHSTTRHLNEYTSLDLEMGFIKDHTDIMEMENKLLAYMLPRVEVECAAELTLLKAQMPEVPSQIPALKLREAQQIIKEKFGEDCSNEPDLEPQHERWICEWAKQEHNSDFIFITHFPLSKRPMYTFEDPNDPGYAAGFDLLFRGIEITTGGQRINDYDKLVESMKKKGVNPEKFSFYLQSFKYGMPPHGGLGMGLERLTAKIIGLDNVKEATLFPRDLNRIDNLLSK
jgi:nondiscriminating aspartyl-tRNA synthetase